MCGIVAQFFRQRRISAEVLARGTKSVDQGDPISPRLDGRRAFRTTTPDARHVFLVLSADVDADGSSLKSFDATDNSAFGYDSYGLTLQNLGTTNIRHSGVVSGDSRPPDPCGAFSGTGGLHQLNVNGSIGNARDTTLPKAEH